MISKKDAERTSAKGGILFYTEVGAEFDFVSAVDGSKHIVGPVYGEAFDSGDKSIGKAMSYAYKAMAFMAFAIPTEGDNDPDATTHTVKAKQPAAQPAKPAAPAPNATVDDAAYHERAKVALKAIYGDDKAAALAKVEELTSFVPKGKTEAERVKGIRDYTKLTGQRLSILAHNIEKLVPPKPIADTPILCMECRQPLDESGTCRNLDCPEGRPAD